MNKASPTQSDSNKVPLSILVPVKNEARNLPRCLAAVSWADEVLVVDSHSTDGTPEIAVQHGATVVQFDYQGGWPKKKNWALATLPFRHEWVFILDADEVLPAGAADEFRRVIADASSSRIGYWINRRFMFMGKWLRHAYYPNWNLRLFKHRLGRYEKLLAEDTESGDNEVHEHVVLLGPTGRLTTDMEHYAFPSVSVFVEKHNRYSNWEARWALAGRRTAAAELSDPAVARRRRLKQLAARLPFRPWGRFLYVYLWQRGFLDGREGYYFARLHAFYEFLSLVKTYELKQQREGSACDGQHELRSK